MHASGPSRFSVESQPLEAPIFKTANKDLMTLISAALPQLEPKSVPSNRLDLFSSTPKGTSMKQYGTLLKYVVYFGPFTFEPSFTLPA